METARETHRLKVAIDTLRSGNSRTLPMLVVAVAVGVFGERFFAVIWRYSVNVLYSDQWDYLKPFFVEQASVGKLFLRQHGPHREGLGLIADKFLYPLTHWNSRVDSFLIGGIIFAAMLLALMLKTRLYGPLAYSDVAIPMIFLSLAQYETLVDVPNPAPYSFPLLLIMVYCLVLLCHNRPLRYTLVLVVNVLLIFTGYGLVMGAITVGYFMLECYWILRHTTSVPFLHAVTGLSVSVVSLASFFIHYRIGPRMGCLGAAHRPFLEYPEFIAVMLSSSFMPSRRFAPAITLLGVALLLIVVILMGLYLRRLLRPTHSDADLIAVILFGFCLLFSAGAAAGRLCVGLDEADRSRHWTLLIPAFLAIYFYLLSRKWSGKRNLVLALLVLFVLPSALHEPRTELRTLANRKRAWAACYLHTENIGYCNQSANLVLYQYPERNGLKQKLDYLRQHRLNSFYDADRK